MEFHGQWRSAAIAVLAGVGLSVTCAQTLMPRAPAPVETPPVAAPASRAQGATEAADTTNAAARERRFSTPAEAVFWCERPADPKATVGALRELSGVVLVEEADGRQPAAAEQRIRPAVRVSTLARSTVLIVLDCGCEIRLREWQRVRVESPARCAALLEAVEPVPVPMPLPDNAFAPASGTPGSGALMVSGVGVGAYRLYRQRRNGSPN